MSRARFWRPVQDSQGNVVPGGSVMIYSSATGLPITDTVWGDIEATTALTLPYTCDSGIIDFYLDRPQFVNVGYTPVGSSVETLFRNVAVEAPGFYVIYLPYTLLGNLDITTGDLSLYVEDDMIVESVRASVGTPPVGGPVVVDVLLDGATSLFTDPGARPTIPDGGSTVVAFPDTAFIPAGHYITMNVVSVGATVVGANLVVQVKARQQSPDGTFPG